MTSPPAKRLLVSTSLVLSPRFGDELMAVCDFLLPHGNRAHHPDSIRLLVVRLTASGALPIVITPGLTMALFLLTVVMCVVSAIAAIMKVTRIDPAMVFTR